MKKIINNILPLSLVLLLGTGCKKYLDVNKDPNNPADVQEALILAPAVTGVSTNLAGGALTIGNYGSAAVITNYWTQQLAINQLFPQYDTYRVRPDDLDQQFLVIYSNILQNLRILNNKAVSQQHHSYGVIAKVLTAYTLGYVTDLWGDVPFSKAFDGALHPTYDKQEDVYKNIQALLDSAITESTLAPGSSKPSSDDLLYKGNMTKWVKFAYSLKARFYMHLTKAPGYNAATQAGLALTALQKGFSVQSDEANFAAYSDNSGSESPWYENVDPTAGPTVLASTFVNRLMTNNDPRTDVLITTGSGGNFQGRVIGTNPAPNFAVYSAVNDFYAGAGSAQPLMTYSELLFLKAEAVFRVSGAAAANPIYINAINSNMSKLGLDTTSAPVLTYLAARGTLTAGNAIQRIMEEKNVANFLSIENFTDWRRTGFPTLTIVQNPYVPSMPRRLPYPLAELTSNPQPQQNLQITDRVWWDAQ
ncbi:MAG: SusD/RagB family nutrient-binding outer membrane lipoprotein [Bacteroidetes bacterium]|nr:SusD/RagB family nutrient-binding outer membrane lipoprotein [Bacteroidota bacterium]